jgi:hypothetical protein
MPYEGDSRSVEVRTYLKSDWINARADKVRHQNCDERTLFLHEPEARPILGIQGQRCTQLLAEQAAEEGEAEESDGGRETGWRGMARADLSRDHPGSLPGRLRV